MAEIRYVKGDATAPIEPSGNKIIVHVCNDVGGWGRGFVLAISRRWDGPEREYRRWAKDGKDFELGKVQFVQVEPDLWVANLIGQHNLYSKKGEKPIRYQAVRSGLIQTAQRAVEMEASVHMPRIGCGLAGGKWDEIEPMLKELLLDFGIPVFVYDFDPPPQKKRANPSGGAGGRGGGRGHNRSSKHAKGGPPPRRNPAFEAFYRS